MSALHGCREPIDGITVYPPRGGEIAENGCFESRDRRRIHWQLAVICHVVVHVLFGYRYVRRECRPLIPSNYGDS